MAHYTSYDSRDSGLRKAGAEVILHSGVCYYMDSRSNSRANTCVEI